MLEGTALLSQLLGSLPTPLLALVACHLPHVALLCLQRCSATLHRLRSVESYMTVAWRHAKVQQVTSGAQPWWSHWWMLSPNNCVTSRQSWPWRLLIPTQLCQTMLRTLEASPTRPDRLADAMELHRLRRWLERRQRAEFILVRRDELGRLWHVEAAEAQHAAGVISMEVLRDVYWKDVHEATLEWRDEQQCCRSTLRACPHLQQYALLIDCKWQAEASHEDTFALLPRLRSLSLTRNITTSDLWTTKHIVERMLDSLPRLTSLRCKDVYISISDLLAITAHSTLEELRLSTSYAYMAEVRWMGRRLLFPPKAEKQLGEASVDAQTGSEGEESLPAWTELDMRRMQAALTRTQPTRRSCEVRLALADLLHRRLMRSGLRTNNRELPAWLLRHHRRKLAWLRAGLHKQLAACSTEFWCG